jgi:hypothetical protein
MNKNEQERAAYNRLILEKEMIEDDLRNDQRKIENSLQNLQEDLQRGYRTLSMLYEEENLDGNPNSLSMQRKNEDQERLFFCQLREAEELLGESYIQQRKTIEEETEELYKKRSEIPWD